MALRNRFAGRAQAFFVCLCLPFVCSPLAAQTGVFPRLLPPASDFRLTLKQEPQRRVPSIASCKGIASQTVPCQVFSVRLENRGGHTVRILRGNPCGDRLVTFWMKSSDTPGGWQPVSEPGMPSQNMLGEYNAGCKPSTSANLRLKPGETTRYVTRLIGPRRMGAAEDLRFPPGSYTFKASWVLRGCTDVSDADDCLTPLQKMQVTRATSLGAAHPVEVESNEIAVASPVLPDLGPLKISFNVVARSGPPPKDLPSDMKCEDGNATIDCVVFHAEVRNQSTQAVQWITYTCTGPGITPEYMTATGDWEKVSIGFPDDGMLVGNGVTRDLSYDCESNVSLTTPILPGEAVERDFTLSGVPPFNTTPIRSPGEHHLRFVLYPYFCFASPDGSFCLTRPSETQPIPSPEITISTQ